MAGLDPEEYTLQELAWAATGRDRNAWDRVAVLCRVLLMPWCFVLEAFGGHAPDLDVFTFTPYGATSSKPTAEAATEDDGRISWKDLVRSTRKKAKAR